MRRKIDNQRRALTSDQNKLTRVRRVIPRTKVGGTMRRRPLAARPKARARTAAPKTIPATAALTHTTALQRQMPASLEVQGLKAWSQHNTLPPPQLAGAGPSVFTPVKCQMSILSYPALAPEAEQATVMTNPYPDNSSLPITTPNNQYRPWGPVMMFLFNSGTATSGFTLNKVVPPLGPGGAAIPYPWQVNMVEFQFPRLQIEANMPVDSKAARYGFDFRNLTQVLQLGGIVRHLRLATGVTFEEVGAVPKDPMAIDFAGMEDAFNKYVSSVRTAGEVITLSASTLTTTHGSYSIPADQTEYGQYKDHAPQPTGTTVRSGLVGGSAWERRNAIDTTLTFDNHIGWFGWFSSSYTDSDGNVGGIGTWTITAMLADAPNSTYKITVDAAGTTLTLTYTEWNDLLTSGDLVTFNFPPLSEPHIHELQRRMSKHSTRPGVGFNIDYSNQDQMDALAVNLADAFKAALESPAMSIHVLLIEPQGDYGAYPATTNQNSYEFTVKQQGFGRHSPDSLLHSVAVPQPTANLPVINKMREIGQRSASFLHTAAEAADAVIGGIKSAWNIGKKWGPSILGAARSVAGLVL